MKKMFWRFWQIDLNPHVPEKGWVQAGAPGARLQGSSKGAA